MFTTATHLSDQSRVCPAIVFKVHFNIMLPYMPRFSKCSLSFSLPHRNTMHFSSPPPYMAHAPPVLYILIWSTNNMYLKSSIYYETVHCSVLPISCYFLPFRPNVLLSIVFSKSLNLLFLPKCEIQSVTPFKISGRIVYYSTSLSAKSGHFEALFK